MPSNVEIKARSRDLERQREIASSLATESGRILVQEDTFFRSIDARLKLRRVSAGEGELILYRRSDAAGPKRSEYTVYHSTQPDLLREILVSSIPVVGTVRKRRLLYIVGQTRIHLDEVDGLGNFIELEVVLREGQSDEEGADVAREFMTILGINEADLVENAYIDLLTGEGK